MKKVMDRKNVYLFELDSVRNTDAEIIRAQKALYNEIAVNGNTVILTYNQLIDSRGFFSLFNDERYQKNIIELFDRGYIKLSQYRDVRTIVQYLINSFEYDKHFIYSGWPLKSTQKRLLALIKRSLIYCDLSDLKSYIDGAKTPEEISDLFIEVTDESKKITAVSALSPEDQKEILSNLYWLLRAVFTLSIKEHIYVPPRDPQEYEEYRLHDILRLVLSFDASGTGPHWDDACRIIAGLSAYRKKSDNRSIYLRELKRKYMEAGSDKEAFQYAEAVVNMCYNYACEISICNTSKRYSFGELSGSVSDGTFREDFVSRLEEYWNIEDPDARFLLDEQETFEPFEDRGRLPDLARALRYANYAWRKKSDRNLPLRGQGAERRYVPRYQRGLTEQIKRQIKRIYSSIGVGFLIALYAIAIAIAVNIAMMCFQDSIHGAGFSIHKFLPAALETTFMLFFSELITFLIAKRWPRLRSLSEAIGDIRCLLIDFFSAVFSKDYRRRVEDEGNDDDSDCYSHGKLIEYIIPREVREYLRLRKTRPELFAPSDQIPICEIDASGNLSKVMRNEELFNNRYGIVYNSDFNMMCVDPIVDRSDGESDFYAYERVIPSAGRGAVIVAKHRGNFVLLKQFRHALRRYQYAFPRGYGEKGLSTLQNAVKELEEELSASPAAEPVYIGTVTPDSGLTRTSADVYMIEIDDYSIKSGYEGIKETVEITEDELDRMISGNRNSGESIFDDGFTLAAYTLLKTSLHA